MTARRIVWEIVSNVIYAAAGWYLCALVFGSPECFR